MIDWGVIAQSLPDFWGGLQVCLLLLAISVGTGFVLSVPLAVARVSARRALDIDRANPVALATLARLAFDAGRGLEARAFVERRLAAGPADADTLLLASQIEKSLGDTVAAERYVQRLRTEFPPNSRPTGTNDD